MNLQILKSRSLQVYCLLTATMFTILWNSFEPIDTPPRQEIFEPIGVTSQKQQTKEETYLPSAHELMDRLVRQTSVTYTEPDLELTYKDAQVLMMIGQAEAEIDGIEGMAAVMQVVLNRVNDPQFPDTVEEVVTQSTTLKDGRVVYQFSPVDIGSYYTTVPSPDAHLALAEIEKGTYNWLDALYFKNKNAEESWQEKNCAYICTIGHHIFYR